MTEKSSETVLACVLCALGAVGLIAFVSGYMVLGWVFFTAFVLMLLWMILTQPDKKDGKGDGGVFGFMGDGGQSDGGGGDGGGGGGG